MNRLPNLTHRRKIPCSVEVPDIGKAVSLGLREVHPVWQLEVRDEIPSNEPVCLNRRNELEVCFAGGNFGLDLATALVADKNRYSSRAGKTRLLHLLFAMRARKFAQKFVLANGCAIASAFVPKNEFFTALAASNLV